MARSGRTTTRLIAAGLARYGFKDMAGEILSGLLAVSTFVDLNRLPELFCGVGRRSREGPTLYPVACAPQAWSAPAAFLLLQSCLGLSLDADKNRFRLDGPYLPEAIPELWIRDVEWESFRRSFSRAASQHGSLADSRQARRG